MSGTEPAMQPFQAELIKAVSGLFGNIPGITPLEENVVRGGLQQAEPIQQLLDMTLRGGFLPGTPGGQANPFLQNLLGEIEAQGDVARRQTASAAQRAGALSGSDYLNLSSGLESQLAQKKGALLGNLYETERQNQIGAIPMLGNLFQQLLGAAQYPRQQATSAQLTPFELGLNLLGTGSSSVIPGQTSPSPFASILSGLGSFAPVFIH